MEDGWMLMKKIGVIAATAIGAFLCAAPVSLKLSQGKTVELTQDKAFAIVGRPGTPGSVAGVARRTTRRAVRRHY